MASYYRGSLYSLCTAFNHRTKRILFEQTCIYNIIYIYRYVIHYNIVQHTIGARALGVIRIPEYNRLFATTTIGVFRVSPTTDVAMSERSTSILFLSTVRFILYYRL